MSAYCALLRGIYPKNPNMRNEKLRLVFERLGYVDVSSLLTSGNILFSSRGDAAVSVMESEIQSALQQDLGIEGGTIVRSRVQLQHMIDVDPFHGFDHSRSTYLAVTFFKEPLLAGELPEPPLADVNLQSYEAEAGALLAVIDSTEGRMPDYMKWLQRQFGQDLTTRTWNTVRKIVAKMPTE